MSSIYTVMLDPITNRRRCLSSILKASATDIFFHNSDGQLGRWLEELSQLNLVQRFWSAKTKEKVEALQKLQKVKTQWSNYRPGVRLEDMPCERCPMCFHANLNCSRVIEAGQHWPWDPGG